MTTDTPEIRGTGAMVRTWIVWPLVPLFIALFLWTTAFASITPSIMDVLLHAICPGQNECSLVISMLGIQIVITGIGAMLIAPILGGFSDDYGRKPVLMLVLGVNIGPAVVLAYSRDTMYVYIWFVINILASMLREAGLLTIAFAIVADLVHDTRQRAPALGFTMSAVSIGLLGGTFLARILTSVQVFWAASFIQIFLVIFMKFFVLETNPRRILLPAAEQVDNKLTAKLLPKISKEKGRNMFKDAIHAARSSKSLRIIAAVAFMVNLTETALQTTLLAYLKALFAFGKDEFAQFTALVGVVAILSQMVVYPVLAHALGERGVLWIGLIGSSINSFLYAIAWAPWVPYFAVVFCIFYSLVPVAIGTLVSRDAEQEQQGKAQGIIASARTLASVVGPLAFSPLTAAFLSDHPPFHFPGFTLAIGGVSMIVAFFISLGLPRLPDPETSFEATLPTETVIYEGLKPADEEELEKEKIVLEHP